MKNTGVDAQDQFEKAMQAQGRLVHRLRDKKDVMGLNKGKRVAMFPCPADFLVGQEGGYFLAEVKSTHEGRFPYGNIRPAQRSAACMAASVGSPYYFFVLDMHTDKWYILPAKQFALDIKAGKKSRSFEELESCILTSW